MWHEARKQEKKIRGLLVDYKKRAERRREYYEKIKQDPTQFIQLHGRDMKIHLDPSVHHAAELPGSLMPWRGDTSCIIDRFDVRAHLDEIPVVRESSPTLPNDELWEERQSNYERYRILVQNEFLEIKEERFLQQIRSEELYGPVGSKTADDCKKSLAPNKAAIPYAYPNMNEHNPVPAAATNTPGEDGNESDDSSDDLDLDLNVDVNQISEEQCSELNVCGLEYGMQKEDFMDLMQKDLNEAESLRLARAHEDEKAMYSGRKSRKERRALKKKHIDRKNSPPSYASRASPSYQPYSMLDMRNRSRSRSISPGPTKVKFITSFGGDSDEASSDGNNGIIIDTHRSRSYDKKTHRSDYYSRNSHQTTSRDSHSSSSRRASSSRYDRAGSSSKSSYDSYSRGSQSSSRAPSSTTPNAVEPPRSRYYGRRGASTDSSDDSPVRQDKSPKRSRLSYGASSTPHGNESTADKASGGSSLHKDRLKKKMQVLLKKQYKADKRIEKEKAVKAEQERQEREDELRGIAVKLRRREKLRNRQHDTSDSDASSSSRSSSRSRKSYR